MDIEHPNASFSGERTMKASVLQSRIFGMNAGIKRKPGHGGFRYMSTSPYHDLLGQEVGEPAAEVSDLDLQVEPLFSIMLGFPIFNAGEQ